MPKASRSEARCRRVNRREPREASIDEWLDTATKNLCADAQVEVSKEIHAHFTDAVQALNADGLSPEEATAAALYQLGPPSSATRKFRKTYLTKVEEKVLRVLSGLPNPLDAFKPRHALSIGAPFALVLLLATAVGQVAGQNSIATAALAAVAIGFLPLFGYLAFVAATVYPIRRGMPHIGLFPTMGLVVFALAVSSMDLYLGLWRELYLFIVSAYGMYFLSRLWLKLCRTASAALARSR
jgi:hypothetical protein